MPKLSCRPKLSSRLNQSIHHDSNVQTGLHAVAFQKPPTALPVKTGPGKDAGRLVESRGLWEESGRWKEATAAHSGGNAGTARLTVSSLLLRAEECDQQAQKDRQGGKAPNRRPADPMERRPAASSLNYDSVTDQMRCCSAGHVHDIQRSFPKPRAPHSVSITQKRIYIDLKRPSMSTLSEEAIAFSAKCGSCALQPDHHGHIHTPSVSPERARK